MRTPPRRRPPAGGVVAVVMVVALAGLVDAAPAQQPASVDERLKRLEEQNAQLLQTIQDLQARIAELEGKPAAAPGEEELPDIEELLKVEPAAPQSAGATGQAGGDPALNPLISFTFDYVANALDKQPALYDADTRQRNRVFGLRAVELNAKRGVSAFGDAFITYGDHGFGPELEEGYIDINRAVDRFNFRLGRWRIPFGPYNAPHEHQLPCVTYPRTITNFFGFHGAQGDGAEITYLPATPDYTEIRLGAYRKIGSHVATAFAAPDEQDSWSGSARVRYNKQLDPQNDVDFTATYLNGPNPDALGARSQLLGLGLQWRQDRGNQNTDRVVLDWVGYRRETALADVERDAWSLLYLRQLDLYNEGGLLYEDAAFGDPGIRGRTRGISAFYTHKPQEQQAFRLQYRRSWYPSGPDTDELMFQSVWSIGNHSHEFN
jgi:hypothetical protein